MVKSIILLAFANVIALQIYAQQNGNETISINDSLFHPLDNNKFLPLKEYIIAPSLLSELNVPNVDFKENSSYTNDMKQFMERNMDQIYNRPKTLLEKGIIRDQLMKLDFNKSQINRISPNLYFYHNSQKKAYTSLGSYIQFNKALRFAPNDRFSADLGGYYSRQFDYLSGQYSDMLGSTLKFSYDLTNRIKYKFWAEYIMPIYGNSYLGAPLFPDSNIGSALVFKITDRTNAEFGVRYQYYQFKKSWNLETYGKLTYDF